MRRSDRVRHRVSSVIVSRTHESWRRRRRSVRIVVFGWCEREKPSGRSSTIRPGRGLITMHPGAEEHGLVDAVGDEHDGPSGRRPRCAQLVLQRSRVSASSAPNGSSISMTLRVVGEHPGDLAALLHAARQLVRAPVGEVGDARPCRARRRRSPGAAALATPRRREPELDVPPHGQPRVQRVGCWNTTPRSGPGHVPARRRPRRVPSVGAMKPAMSRSSVVLPHPTGPTRQTNSPGLDGQVDAVERHDVAGARLVAVAHARRWRPGRPADRRPAVRAESPIRAVIAASDGRRSASTAST